MKNAVKSQSGDMFCHDVTEASTVSELASIKTTIMLFVCPSKIFQKYCFYFLLGLTMVPRETGNNGCLPFAGWNVNGKAI